MQWQDTATDISSILASYSKEGWESGWASDSSCRDNFSRRTSKNSSQKKLHDVRVEESNPKKMQRVITKQMF